MEDEFESTFSIHHKEFNDFFIRVILECYITTLIITHTFCSRFYWPSPASKFTCIYDNFIDSL